MFCTISTWLWGRAWFSYFCVLANLTICLFFCSLLQTATIMFLWQYKRLLSPNTLCMCVCDISDRLSRSSFSSYFSRSSSSCLSQHRRTSHFLLKLKHFQFAMAPFPSPQQEKPHHLYVLLRFLSESTFRLVRQLPLACVLLRAQNASFKQMLNATIQTSFLSKDCCISKKDSLVSYWTVVKGRPATDASFMQLFCATS